MKGIKPKHPKSNYAVAGLYFYPNDVVNIQGNSYRLKDKMGKEVSSVN